MYPSIIASPTNPNPTDRLNAPSHSGIETAQNTEIVAIEIFVGTLASTAGTLVYDVRSPSSNGGGHVQTAVLGGTGQTSYTKGDLLVGQSASVVSRMAVGTTGQLLSVDSTTSTGLKYIDNSKPKLVANGSVYTLLSGNGETSLISVTVPGSTLGTSNFLRTKVYIDPSDMRSSVLVKAVYGGTVISSILLASPDGGFTTVLPHGTIDHVLIGNSTTNSQRSKLDITLLSDVPLNGSRSSVYGYVDSKTSAIDGSANQTYGITAQVIGTGNINIGGYTVEKIN